MIMTGLTVEDSVIVTEEAEDGQYFHSWQKIVM